MNRAFRYCACIVALLTTAIGTPALGCAVCFGDPDSLMAKGAFAGVMVLFLIIGFVLTGVAGTAFFWLHRSRRISRCDGLEGSD